ncbi:MAG: hypothetical protein K5888_11280 [Lachnospiraceae bacterium]|nr:hypothetical protein [Lachnospiraceae bacterium]
MADIENKFKNALTGKNIPILTIDKKFHNLTDAIGKSDEMSSLEGELNDLLKAQGKANTEIKEIKKLKKKLMQEIVENADENSDSSEAEKEKKAEENTRLIAECNEKIEKYEDDIIDLPKMIDEVNKKLMVELMDDCYNIMKANEVEIAETAKWITQIRIELKKRLVKKQDMETKNQEIYSYMHDIFGAEVIEIFDMTYKDTKLQ